MLHVVLDDLVDCFKKSNINCLIFFCTVEETFNLHKYGLYYLLFYNFLYYFKLVHL